MAYGRIYNFSAGPSVLPETVLEQAQKEFLNYNGSGMSVMEMSHRSKVYDEIIVACEANFRKVMNIPDNYSVLLLQGGATQQFAAIPMNFMNKNNTADYILSGNFATNAWKEAKKYGDARVAATTEVDGKFTRVAQQNELTLNPNADYLHICYNNTIFGTVFNYIPETGNVPLVADMSSCILSEPVDVSKFGVIYAGAQKNIAPAGLTLVIVRNDLLGNAMPFTPTMLNYAVQAEKKSMYNTPSTYPIYMAKLVLEWIENLGGLTEMQKINQKKAALLYDYIDNSKLFFNPVAKENRSMMNVVFRTESDELNDKFVKESAKAGFSNLKGHRISGGMRASIYNAMPVEGVEKLVEFMTEFEKNN